MCHDLDIKRAVVQSSTLTRQSYAAYSAAAQHLNAINDELEQRQRQATALDQIISYSTLSANNAEILRALTHQVADTKSRIKYLVCVKLRFTHTCTCIL